MNELQTIYKTLFKAFGPQHWWPGDTPFEIAVGAILTQNTNWGNVEKAIDNLKAAQALSARKIHEMSTDKLAALIRPAGYFNVKAKRLKAFISLLMDDHQGSMKRMKNKDMNMLRGKLLSVNGIGPETADSMLLYALDKPIFVIDAYTKRILSRHGIIGHDEPYEAFQGLFHEALRRDTRLFNEYHALFVRTGKDYCRPKPLCHGCPLYDILSSPAKKKL
jgi:endonuclease-3 related protein